LVRLTFKARWPAAGRQAASFAKPQPDKMRDMQRPRALFVVGLPACASFGDVAHRIGTLIAITRGVGRSANADGIHHKDHGTHFAAFAGSGHVEAKAAVPVTSL